MNLAVGVVKPEIGEEVFKGRPGGTGRNARSEDRTDLQAALDATEPATRDVLERTAARIRAVASAPNGPRSAEAMGDYGAGPNHTLPTGRTARAGLSVLDFLRARTWLDLANPNKGGLAADAIALARIEGPEAHARSAEHRL